MIARLHGKLLSRSPDSVVVDVGGVGYEVFVPLSTYYELPEEGSDVTLFIHTSVREDAIQLYGFSSASEKETFRMLINVSGVGPKLARNLLSGTSVEGFLSSIAGEDVVALKRLPGVGTKTAERIILELRDKVRTIMVEARPAGGESGAGDSGVVSDVVSALANLGYKTPQAREAVKKARAVVGEAGEEAGFEELLKGALKALASR